MEREREWGLGFIKKIRTMSMCMYVVHLRLKTLEAGGDRHGIK